MSYVTIYCAYCGSEKEISYKEWNRQTKRGRVNWFCSNSCSAKYNNSFKKSKIIIKICPQCGKEFESTDSVKSKTYCSSSCASIATVPPSARSLGGKNSSHTPESTAKMLKHREAYKYIKLKEELEKRNIAYEFEKCIDGKVFDLALSDLNICVEFDGPEHRTTHQKCVDDLKNKIASNNGFTIKRIITGRKEIINPEDVFNEIHKAD